MPRAEHWSQLKVGILVFTGIVVAVTAVMTYARVGALHGETTRLYMVTDIASGVLSGTEVRLAGQKVGLVRSVELRPPSSDTSERVLITMDVLNQYLKYVRRNSDVQIRPGGRLVGSPIVAISMGTSHATGLVAGDTLRAKAQAVARSGFADASSLGDSLSQILATASTLKSDFDSTAQSVAAVRRQSERQAEAVEAAIDNLSNRAVGSNGTIASLVRDSASLRAQATRVSALADSIGAAANGNGETGRFRRDSTLVIQARRTLATVADLRSRIARYSGGTARGAALARQLDRAGALMDSVVQDAKRHPLRYVAF
jgi:ABC-type transporter Mla subunit MlaD